MPKDSMSLSEVVGQNARDLRLQNGLTLEDVASRARNFGLKWNTARVVELERGNLSISMPVLAVLRFALGDDNVPIPMSALLANESDVAITNLLSVQKNQLPALFSDSQHLTEHLTISPSTEQIATGLTSASDWLTDQHKKLPQGMPMGIAFEVMKWNTGLTEERAAKKLGLSVYQLNVYSNLLWGKSLSQRRDEILSESEVVTPQKSGHVTRGLIDEISEKYNSEMLKPRTQYTPSFVDDQGVFIIGSPTNEDIGIDLDLNLRIVPRKEE